MEAEEREEWEDETVKNLTREDDRVRNNYFRAGLQEEWFAGQRAEQEGRKGEEEGEEKEEEGEEGDEDGPTGQREEEEKAEGSDDDMI